MPQVKLQRFEPDALSLAVGYIDCGTHDRWTTWEGGPRGRGVISEIVVPAGSITYVVDPALRCRITWIGASGFCQPGKVPEYRPAA